MLRNADQNMTVSGSGRVPLVCAFVVLLLSGSALIGWMLGQPPLRLLFPELQDMIPLTALSLFLTALAILLFQSELRRPSGWPARGYAAYALTAFVAALAALTLVGYLGVEQVPQPTLLRELVELDPQLIYHGRMSPQASLIILCTTLALLLRFARAQPLTVWVYQTLLGLSGAFSILAVIGFLYQIMGLFALSQRLGISLPNALSNVCLSIGALYLEPQWGLVRWFSEKSTSGLFLRRFALLGFFFPFLTAGVVRWIEVRYELDSSMAAASFVVLNVFAFLGLALLTANSIRQAEENQVQLHLKQVKLEETELRERQVQGLTDRLNQALTAAGMATWERDLHSGLVTCSDMHYRLFGLNEKPERWTHLDFLSRVHPDDRERVRQVVEQAARGEVSVYALDFRVLWPDGTIHWMGGRGQVVRDPQGQVTALRGAILDIQRLKETELQLQKAKSRAEIANQMKTAFLSNVSHEIRTPMTAILGFTELLRESDLSESDRQDFIMRIDRSGRNLLRLIDDILDISKIDAGRLQFEKTTFSPVEAAREVISMMSLQAAAKGLRMVLENSPEVPEKISSDPNRLRQILVNVIGNAVKFTTRGEVRIGIRVAHEASETLEFRLSDTGIGIAPDDQAKLFQPFAQADESITRRFGGTGLGLALSRRLAEGLGGSLKLLRSVPGEGSVFILTLSCGPWERPEAPDPVHPIEDPRG